MPHLTATMKIRANVHDRHLLAVAAKRWHHAYQAAMDRAKARDRELLRCIVPKQMKNGTERLVVDGAAFQTFVKSVCRKPEGLHSAFHMSLIVAVGESLSSWLGLYLAWLASGKKTPKPSFPTVPPASDKQALAQWEQALAQSAQVGTLAEEDAWRAEVTRAARGRRMPIYFGAATSGVKGQAHMGLIRRAGDNNLFALLTLFPAGDPLGQPLERARNRMDRGALRNLRGEEDFTPTPKAKSGILCPLEFNSGMRKVFVRRAVPKTAEVVNKDGDLRLHVAFEFPDHPGRQLDGSVLAVKRGVGTLLAWVLVRDGKVCRKGVVDGKELAALITGIRNVRSIRQQKGKTTKGDRKAARVAEHHVFSACRQIRDIACRENAEVVLLDDARKPDRWLGWRHWARIEENLGRLCVEAGLPEPKKLKIYGAWHTCAHCGWMPGENVADPKGVEDGCPRCGAVRGEHHLALLCAAEALRRRGQRDGEKLGPLGVWLKANPVA